MEKAIQIQELRDLIAEGNIQETIQVLTENRKLLGNEAQQNNIIMLSASWNKIQKDIENKLISKEDRMLRLQRINYSLLHLLDGLESEPTPIPPIEPISSPTNWWKVIAIVALLALLLTWIFKA